MGVQRLRVTATIEHYAATAVKLVRLSPGDSVTVGLSPTLLPERLLAVNELTRVALTIVVENLTQPGEPLVEEHKSLPLWLLARNAAPLAVRDPVSGQWTDMSRYMGAFVTPNTPAVMRFLRSTAQHHPDRRLTGYQSDPIEPQVAAIFAALKAEGQITYVNSVIAFNPEQSARSQRVRSPGMSGGAAGQLHRRYSALCQPVGGSVAQPSAGHRARPRTRRLAGGSHQPAPALELSGDYDDRESHLWGSQSRG